jgi:putative oxidoreductase
MDVIVRIGRILFVAIFLASGVAHLTQTRDLEGYVISKGLRRASLLIQVSGVQMLVGGLTVLFGVWMDLGFLILAAFLIPAAVLFQPSGTSATPSWPMSSGRISWRTWRWSESALRCSPSSRTWDRIST